MPGSRQWHRTHRDLVDSLYGVCIAGRRDNGSIRLTNGHDLQSAPCLTCWAWTVDVCSKDSVLRHLWLLFFLYIEGFPVTSCQLYQSIWGCILASPHEDKSIPVHETGVVSWQMILFSFYAYLFHSWVMWLFLSQDITWFDHMTWSHDGHMILSHDDHMIILYFYFMTPPLLILHTWVTLTLVYVSPILGPVSGMTP